MDSPAERRIKILYITETPSPYRVCFFRKLSEKCDLSVIFTKKRKQYERPLSWYDYNFDGFNAIDSNNTRNPINLTAIKQLNKKYDLIVLCDYSSPTGLISALLLKFRHIKYAMEADGAKIGTGNLIKEKLKKAIISKSVLCFSSSNVTDDYYIHYGADKKLLVRYPFTSLIDSDVIKEPTTPENKNELRKLLGLTEKKIIISVGRFSYMSGYGKGYDTVMELAELSSGDTGFYIIGDKPTAEFEEWKKRKSLTNVHFIEHKSKDALKQYYQSADISMLLSRGEAWGLVINESMANGTPVIATDACVGALEIIKHSVNGYIVPVNSPESVNECIKDFFSSSERQRDMSAAALDTIKDYTIENMAKTHIEVFRRLAENDNN